MINRKLSAIALLAALVGACASSPPAIQASAQAVPSRADFRVAEAATGFLAKAGVSSKNFMVATANPHASDAGYQMLRAGGSAIDAAIAIQLVLGIVEPQSSGIGGGAFMLYFDGHDVKAYDGRETAPAAADEKLFQDAQGKPIATLKAIIGGRSVGAPGVLRMLEMVHRRYGKLPWSKLFEPAIALAEQGFSVSPRLRELTEWVKTLKDDPVAASFFYGPDGKAWPVGHVLKNPAFAQTLREIAAGGADAFYLGRIAQDIAAKVKNHPTNPGLLSVADIAAYRPRERQPICGDYKLWTVCGMPPPSSGGMAIGQMLGILAHKDMAALAPLNGELQANAVHWFAEAGRLAYADRGRYLADPDFVAMPGADGLALLDKNYLAGRAALMGEMSMGRAEAGQPPGAKLARGRDAAPDLPSTSHFSIVDGDGHGLAMTTSLEYGFGSNQMVDGFLINNQLSDFSFDSADADGPVANRVQAGKRPRSSMSPTLVFEKESKKLVLVIGSPGSASIINYVAKVLVGMMDWGLDVRQAIDLPNFGSRNGPTDLEAGRVSPRLVDALKAKGHAVRVTDLNSGLHGIMRMTIHGEDVWFGAADPRREGSVKGD